MRQHQVSAGFKKISTAAACGLLLLALSVEAATPAWSQQADNTRVQWQQHLERAHAELQNDDRDKGMKELHLALQDADRLSTEAVSATLNTIVAAYRDLGEWQKANHISLLVLTPHSAPTDYAYIRAYKEKVRKRQLLIAGDGANAEGDYLLADILYSALLPTNSLSSILKRQSYDEGDMEAKVVDRLVRLYAHNGDCDRAEALVRSMRQRTEMLNQGSRMTEVVEIELAMLKADLALIRFHQGRLDEANKLFEKATIDLERAGGSHNPQLATVYCDFAHVAIARKRPHDAESSYRHALHIADNAEHINEGTLKTILESYSRLLRDEGKTEQAEKLEHRLNDLHERQSSSAHLY